MGQAMQELQAAYDTAVKRRSKAEIKSLGFLDIGSLVSNGLYLVYNSTISNSKIFSLVSGKQKLGIKDYIKICGEIQGLTVIHSF